MIGDQSVLAIIPARGGSKGIPDKNITPVAGKPLIAWTIEAAQAAATLDRVILSSDSEKIARVAAEYGCEVPFMRPASLAADVTPGIEPIMHALEQLSGFDLVVVLQPTSPLRAPADIDTAVGMCTAPSVPAVISVTAAAKPPEWMYYMNAEGGLEAVLDAADVSRRQDSRPVWCINGAVYVAKVTWLREHRNFMTAATRAYEMPAERSLDIDTPFDLKLAEALLQAPA